MNLCNNCKFRFICKTNSLSIRGMHIYVRNEAQCSGCEYNEKPYNKVRICEWIRLKRLVFQLNGGYEAEDAPNKVVCIVGKREDFLQTDELKIIMACPYHYKETKEIATYLEKIRK